MILNLRFGKSVGFRLLTVKIYGGPLNHLKRNYSLCFGVNLLRPGVKDARRELRWEERENPLSEAVQRLVERDRSQEKLVR